MIANFGFIMPYLKTSDMILSPKIKIDFKILKYRDNTSDNSIAFA